MMPEIQRVRNILFDLDGTLTDPGEGITKSVAYALRKCGIEPPAREALYAFIGPPLIDSFMQCYGMNREEAKQAVKFYREYFAETGIFENCVYSGITELLERLKKAGKRLAIATSKPEPYAERIAERFGLSKHLDFTAGALMDETRTGKGEVIRYALERGGFLPAETVMVGDRMHDVIGAKENGLPCIGVLFGYGSREELAEAGASALAKDPEELYGILKK